jgi:hypothetical protein
MKREVALTHQFVKNIPEKIEGGVVYVSIEYATAIHRCACGCGHEVVTPLSPYEWQLTHDGESVSLHPSIGNWSFPCQSHYWVRKNAVVWASRWSREEIAAGRAHDQQLREGHVGEQAAPALSGKHAAAKVGVLRKLWERLKGKF